LSIAYDFRRESQSGQPVAAVTSIARTRTPAGADDFAGSPTDGSGNGLEQLRDSFDRRDLGLILIGMPGFDRQLARYPQLYSRIGFAHQYKPLDTEDIPAVLAQYWQQLGPPDSDVDPDTEVVGTIVRITGGNFRLIDRPRRTRGPGSPCRPWQNDRSEQVMKQEKSPGG